MYCLPLDVNSKVCNMSNPLQNKVDENKGLVITLQACTELEQNEYTQEDTSR